MSLNKHDYQLCSLKRKQIIKGMNDQYTELMPVVMIIPLLYIEANKINMASYVLADLSGHCERELFFILFVVWLSVRAPVKHLHVRKLFFNVSNPHTC